MNRSDFPQEKIYLKPGELIVSEDPVLVTTVLGSCISVTMFNPRLGVAAICHSMLPTGGKSENFKYVDTSIHYMVKYFSRLKAARKDIQVKLFGGGDMFDSVQQSRENLTIGSQNISVASRCLKEYGLTVLASDVGGKVGRKLIFRTDTGDVFIKKMSERVALPSLR